MSAQAQLGFALDAEPEQTKTGNEIVKEAFDSLTEERRFEIMQEIGIEEEISDPPEVEAEQPALFEGFAPVQKEQEPEIPWAEYIRKVELYFDEAQFKAFRENVSKLAVKHGTESVTDTVAAILERAANGTN